MFGKLFHYSLDALMVSIILAAVHRETGLVCDVGEGSNWKTKFLALGEVSYDYLVSMLQNSGYFTRRPITSIDDLKKRVKNEVDNLMK